MLVLAIMVWGYLEYSRPGTTVTTDVIIDPPPPVKPVVPPEPSRTDVVIAEIVLPKSVTRNKDFEYVVVLKNVGFKVADGSTVKIRAGKLPGNNPNLGLGESLFLQLRPGQIQSKTIRSRAPHLAGVWLVNATVQPSSDSNYIDEENNDREAQLVVN
jgi:hypothetical protein